MSSEDKTNLLTNEGKNKMIDVLDNYMLQYGPLEVGIVKEIVEYLMDTVFVKITFDHHDETHTGYCSDPIDETEHNYESVFIYEIPQSIIRYDEDGDIDITSVDHLKIDWRCDIGSGYCGGKSHQYPKYVVHIDTNDCKELEIKYYGKYHTTRSL